MQIYNYFTNKASIFDKRNNDIRTKNNDRGSKINKCLDYLKYYYIYKQTK